MTQEEKDLLLKDLSARLPYRVLVMLDKKFGFNKGKHELVKELLDSYCVEGIKPYLRPLSSMTDEEDKEWQLYKSRIAESCDELLEERIAELHDWFCEKHFDYRNLIGKGLALEAPEGMYKTWNSLRGNLKEDNQDNIVEGVYDYRRLCFF